MEQDHGSLMKPIWVREGAHASKALHAPIQPLELAPARTLVWVVPALPHPLHQADELTEDMEGVDRLADASAGYGLCEPVQVLSRNHQAERTQTVWLDR